MVYYLSVVEIIHEINQYDMPSSPKSNSEMAITKEFEMTLD
ncbi:MAG: hypothetical protein ACTS85_03770 [Arsenophonus sp. NC-PG7-MAG3]